MGPVVHGAHIGGNDIVNENDLAPDEGDDDIVMGNDDPAGNARIVAPAAAKAPIADDSDDNSDGDDAYGGDNENGDIDDTDSDDPPPAVEDHRSDGEDHRRIGPDRRDS